MRTERLKRFLGVSAVTTFVAVVALLARAAPIRAQVENLCLLELDGDTSVESGSCTNPPDKVTGTANDWDFLAGLAASGGAATITPLPPGAGSGFFGGVVASAGDVFSQGTKALDPISTWFATRGNAPNKADLAEGAAATYTYTGPSFTNGVNTNDDILYVESIRDSNNGNELNGVWLFQEPVAFNSSTGAFTGNHAEGDLFLLSTFTTGGTVPTVQVFKWSCGKTAGTDCGNNGSLAFFGAAACGGGNDSECGGVNTAAITPASTIIGRSVLANEFLEEGADLTATFPGGVPCFSTIMFESVASSSCSSTPCTVGQLGKAAAKAFLIAPFNTCSIGTTKNCPSGTVNSGSIMYNINGVVTNTGGGPVTDLTVSDSPVQIDAGSLKCATYSSGCPTDQTQFSAANCMSASLSANQKICWEATFTADPTKFNGSMDTVTATMNAGVATVTGTSTATCPMESLSTAISVDKTCTAFVVLNASGSALEFEVDAEGEVTNSIAGTCTGGTNAGLTCGSNEDCPGGTCSATTTGLASLTGVSVCDTTRDPTCASPLLSNVTLTPGQSAPYSEVYNPTLSVGTNAICQGGISGNGIACTSSSTCAGGGTCQIQNFMDTVKATGTCNDPGLCDPKVPVTNTATASCPLCPPTLK